MGNLETFPLVAGHAKIMEIDAGGKILSDRTGLTNIVSAIHDKSGNLYVLESTTGNPFPTPDAGIIVQVKSNGETETIASGLSLPTAMTFGPDGALYVSNKGYGYPAGNGEIVRVAFSPDGDYAAFGAHDGAICVWDLQQADVEPRLLVVHTEWINKVKVLPDASIQKELRIRCVTHLGSLAGAASDPKSAQLCD